MLVVPAADVLDGRAVRLHQGDYDQVQPAFTQGKARRHVEIFDDPMRAATRVDLVTTDVWTSMGFEGEEDARRTAFEGFTVDARMMTAAGPEALFMHCLPAHRGEEVTEDVLEGRQSVVWDEAENRLHVQKALLALLVD